MRHHPPCGLLDNEEPAIGRYLDCFTHGVRVELGDRTVRPCARVVEHRIGLPEPAIGIREQAGDRRVV